MMFFSEESKTIEPSLTQKQISKQLGFSDKTIKRYTEDNG